MKKIVLNVTGMSCAHCEKRVNTALSALTGIKKASANAKKNSVTVSFDESVIDDTKVKEAIVEAGYEVAPALGDGCIDRV